MKLYKMGRHFCTKNVDDEQDHQQKQPSCMSGLVYVLAYHHRRYKNGRKIIRHNKYGGQTCLKGDCSPKTSLLSNDGCEVEKILDGYENESFTSKRSCGISRKKSLRSRLRKLASEELLKGGENAKNSEGFKSKARLERTYSMHHLKSLDDKIGKICTGWKQPIIFLPRKIDICSEGSNDAFQIIATDENESSCKEYSDSCQAAISESIEESDDFFMKKSQDSEEGLDLFSGSGALGLNRKEKERLSKSRSFPDCDSSQRLKFKPSKLEHKQKETWSSPKTGKSSAVNQELKLAPLGDLGMSSEKTASDKKDTILEQLVVIKTENEVVIELSGEYATAARKYSHRRSASLNESLDRYARLLEHNNRIDNKLYLSNSLKMTNETGKVPIYFRKIRSLSNVDSYYSGVNFDEIIEDGSSIAGSVALGVVVEKEEHKVKLLVSDGDNVPEDIIETPEIKSESESFVFLQENEDDPILAVNVVRNNSDMEECLKEEAEEELSRDHCLSKDSNSLLQETLSHAGQLQNSEGRYTKNGSALRYVRYILDQSGIAENASDRAWHSSDQPLSPQLLEDAKDYWSHEWDDQFSTEPKSCCCWHHRMLFDLTNEVLIQIYDHSLPYYPKALSSACHVHPFPVGARINEDVSTRILKVLDSTLQEKQSLDCVMARDFGGDNRWMNLQFESQCVALELEDVIFYELLEEVMQL